MGGVRPTGVTSAQLAEPLDRRAASQKEGAGRTVLDDGPGPGRSLDNTRAIRGLEAGMSLSDSLRASALHIELLQDKRVRLGDALMSAELQFLAALRREDVAGQITWAQLRDAYSILSAGRLRGLRARWLDAIGVSPEEVILNAKRSAAGGASGLWSGHLPLLHGEYYPPTGQSVVFVLFDPHRHPIHVSNTDRCSERFAELRAQGNRWSSWTAHAVDKAEAVNVQARLTRHYQTNGNRQRVPA